MEIVKAAKRLSREFMGEHDEGRIWSVGVNIEEIVVHGTTLEVLATVPWEYEGHEVKKVLCGFPSHKK